MSSRYVALCTAVFVCLLLVSSTVGAAAFGTADAGGPDASVAAVSSVDGWAQTATPVVNNSTNESAAAELVPLIGQEDPRIALGRGSNADIGNYLVGSMATRLASSARLLNEGEYPESRAVLGSEYESLYVRYDTVRGDLGRSREAADRYIVVRDEQIRYVDAVQNYTVIREGYLEARRDANPTRSRRLAREMEVEAEIVLERRDNLVANYTLMTEMSGDVRNETIRLIDLQATTVTAQQATVRNEEFIDTDLFVRPSNQTGSFAAPYRLFATVTTANDTPLSNVSGQFTVGSQRFPVRTDEAGRFFVDYRPTTIPEGRSDVEARFFVDEQSPYLGDRTRFTLVVIQEPVNVTVAATPDTVAFDEVLSVSGTVGAVVPNATSYDERRRAIEAYRDGLRATAEAEAQALANETGEPVEVNETRIQTAPLPHALREPLPTEYAGAGNVTLAAAIGDLRLGTIQTDRDGRFEFQTVIGSDVRLGQQPVRIGLVETDRALAPTTAATTITVEETPTTVRLEEVTTRGSELVAAGMLTTASGTPLADQEVELRFDGGVVQTVRTTEDGGFATSIPLPDADESRSFVRFVAAFATPTTNLASSRTAATVVQLPAPRAPRSDEVPVIAQLREALGLTSSLAVVPLVDLQLTPSVVAALVGLLVLVAGLVFVVRRRRAVPITTAGRRTLGDVSAATLLQRGRPDPADVTDTTPPSVYLRAARDALAASNPRLATEYAYVAVRRSLASDPTLPSRGTHREFFVTLRDRKGGFDDIVSLLTLTTAYERAAFSPSGVSASDADEAITLAERLVD